MQYHREGFARRFLLVISCHGLLFDRRARKTVVLSSTENMTFSNASRHPKEHFERQHAKKK
jgi:hypothetical protein